MKNNKIFFLTLLLSSLVSCAPSRQVSNETAEFTSHTISTEAIFLEKQTRDQTRISSIESTDEYDFSLLQIIDGSYQRSLISFTGQIKDNYVKSLASTPIDSTYYSGSSNITLNYMYNELSADYDTLVGYLPGSSDVGSEVFLSASTEYLKDTIEAASLSVSHSITKSYNAVMQADPTLYLPSVTVHISPKNVQTKKYINGPDHLKQKIFYQTDNAYYLPSSESITFLPHSKAFKQVMGKASFWEIPMVASHEYSHHIFKILISNHIQQDHSFSKGCFKNDVNFIDVTTNSNKTRDNSSSFALASINEGFADLIPFYTLEQNEAKLTDILCFQKNREVDSRQFGAFHEKVLNKSNIETINSPTKIEAVSTNCNTPNLQQIHDVGAYFAYNANKVIGSFSRIKQSKLKILLDWAKTLPSEQRDIANKKAGDYILLSLERLYKKSIEHTVDPTKVDVSQECGNFLKMLDIDYQYKCHYLK